MLDLRRGGNVTYEEGLALASELQSAGILVVHTLTLTRRLEPRAIDALWTVVQQYTDGERIVVELATGLDPEVEAELRRVKEFVEARP